MLLEAKELVKSYQKSFGMMNKQKVGVLKGVSFTLNEGESLGIIGESGSGKSTLGRIIIGLEKPDSGTIRVNNFSKDQNEKNTGNNKSSVVFQDYSTSVNPRFKVWEILFEPMHSFKNMKKKEKNSRAIHLLEKVGLSEKYLHRYPHELSGGQLQRVCIARALTASPHFIILDEAISSLDVSIQVQVMDLLIDLKQQMNIAYLFITHDLTAITYMCDRVLFFCDGKVIEEVKSIHELKNVKNDYSKALLNAAMKMNGGVGRKYEV